MKLTDVIVEAVQPQGGTAVVGWGRGMGHKGHMLLARAVIVQAQQMNAQPLFFVSQTMGKDDPLTPEEKLGIYKKVFPKYANIFQTGAGIGQLLSEVAKSYPNVVLVLGEDQVQAFQFLVRPDKSGNVPFKTYGLNDLQIIARQQVKDPAQQEAGPRATPMREVLLDPNASDEQKFAMWRRDMPDALSDQEVMALMKKAQQRLTGTVDEAMLGFVVPQQPTKQKPMDDFEAKLLANREKKRQEQQAKQKVYHGKDEYWKDREVAVENKNVNEVSDKTLYSYLTKLDADSRKHKADPSKRSPEKANRSVKGFSQAFNKLDSRKPDGTVEEDWQKTNQHDKTDGMSPKAVKAYRRENPGSKLKTAVTKKPSELKAGSKDAKRRKSFCARMGGMKGPMKDEHGEPTAKAKALRRWNCESVEDMHKMIETAQRVIAEEKQRQQGLAEIAGAFPSPSTREKWAKDAAISNAAEAKRQAAKAAQADAERLKTNTDLVDKEQKINYHSLDGEAMPPKTNNGVEEAKKANTKTARAEFSKRDKKPTLSDKEQQSKQSESDRLWAMLQQHIADAEKNKEQGVAEADKHSFVGKIQRGHELKKKVDSTFKDIGDAQKKGDKEAGSNAFRKHERYANLERPGTWTKSVDEAGYGNNRGYAHGFASPTAPQLGARRREDDEGNPEYDDKIRKMTGMIFYNIPDTDEAYEEADIMGMKRTRTGKWYLPVSAASFTIKRADKLFGQGKIWYPKNESVSEAQSARAKLQKAFQREQERGEASRKRGEELLNPKKEEPKKEVSESLAQLVNRMRPLMAEATVEQKVKMLKLMKEAKIDMGEKMKKKAERLQKKEDNPEEKEVRGKRDDVAEDNDPCWTGYKQIGMKKKGGKKVPNCVPVNEDYLDE